MTQQQMVAEIARLQAENAGLKVVVASNSKLTLKVSEKGAVSMYGLGRWPVTLYREQWERVLEAGDTVKAFIAAHGDELSTKEDKAVSVPAVVVPVADAMAAGGTVAPGGVLNLKAA